MHRTALSQHLGLLCMAIPITPRLWRTRLQHGLKRAGQLSACCAAFYAGFLLLGFVPVNRDYTPPEDDDCVRMFIRSNEIHTDLVVPARDEATGIDWRELFPPEHFRDEVVDCQYVAVGWGNRAFYVDTPRWVDLKLATALRTLFPDEGVLHAEYLYRVAPGDYFREVRLSRDQYRQLAAFIRNSVGRVDEQGRAIQVTNKSYNHRDRFYCAAGSYHAFNTCNQWTGRGLKQAGVPTGIWTPLKPQVLCWLKS